MTRTTYLVDDDAAVRNAMRGLLDLQPDQTLLDFGSGEAFLDVAGEVDPGVLLLDLNMPRLGGMEVLQALRAFPGKFAVLVLTGMGTVPRALDAMRDGVFDFLEKPCPVEQLLDTVDAAHADLALKREAIAGADKAKAQIDTLSGRERDVLMGLLDGLANKNIAFALDISARTVEIYRANLMHKLQVRSLPAVMRIAFAAGMAPGGQTPRTEDLSGIMTGRDRLAPI
ncbi:MAG: response regulator [Sphingomonas sp.]|jgi:two-component system response regulator FixJ|uniref:response regulator transcription factor n=1 Tax=Sphingomonas sp. TaxID=28214 RepID=UPI0035651C74